MRRISTDRSDAGAHWSNVSSNLPHAPANSVVVDPNDANTVYVALDTGVYVTTQITTCATANCWSIYGTGLPNAPVVELAAAQAMPTGDGRAGELRAATYGRGSGKFHCSRLHCSSALDESESQRR